MSLNPLENVVSPRFASEAEKDLAALRAGKLSTVQPVPVPIDTGAAADLAALRAGKTTVPATAAPADTGAAADLAALRASKPQPAQPYDVGLGLTHAVVEAATPDERFNIAAGPLNAVQALTPQPIHLDLSAGPRNVVAALTPQKVPPIPPADYAAVKGAGSIDPLRMAARAPKGAPERIGRFLAQAVPGLGPQLQHEEESQDAYAQLAMRKLVPRAPTLAPGAQGQQQTQRLKALDNLLNDYERHHVHAPGLEAGLGAIGENIHNFAPGFTGDPASAPPLGSVPPPGPLIDQKALAAKYAEAAKAYNWKDFGAYLRKSGFDKIGLTPWDKQVLTAALAARRLSVAHQAAADQRSGADTFNFVLGAAIGGGAAKIAMPYLAGVRGPIGAMARFSMTPAANLGERALQALNPVSEGAIANIAGQEVMAQPKNIQEAGLAAALGYGLHAGHGLLGAPFKGAPIEGGPPSLENVLREAEARGIPPPEGFEIPAAPEIKPGDVVRLDNQPGRLHDVHQVDGHGKAIITGRRNPVPVERLTPVAPAEPSVVPETPTHPLTEGTQELQAGLNLKNLFPKLEDSQGYLRNFSDIGAARSATTHGLSQLEKAHPETNLAARAAASSRPIADNMLRQTEAGIDRVYGRPQAHKEFYRTLGDSQLIGKMDQYREYGAKAFNIPDSDFDPKHLGDTLRVLKLTEGGATSPQPGSAAVEKAVQAGDFDAARMAMAQSFNHAADIIETRLQPPAVPGQPPPVDRIAAVHQAMQDPKFGQALDLYRQTLEAPLREFHTAVGGQLVDPKHLGPAQAYFPLTAVDENGAVFNPRGGFSPRLPFKRPNNPRANFRTGLSEQYAYDPLTLKDQVQRAVKANATAHMWDVAESAGLVRRIKAGQDVPTGGYKFKGKEYTPTIEASGPLRTFLRQGGENFTQRGQLLHMPAWFRDEVSRIVSSPGTSLRANTFGQFTGGLVKGAVLDPALGLIHGRNLLSVLITNTPQLEGISGKLPVLKAFAAAWQAGHLNLSSAENLEIQRILAKYGVLHPETGEVTASRSYAQSTGAGFSPVKAMLYGPSGIDVRTRVLLYKVLKAENPGATPQQVIERVGQAGQYIKPLQGWLQAQVLGPTISPFFEAGKTMTANAIRGTVPGLQPVQATGARAIQLKALQQLSGGLAGITGAWIAAHKAATGKYPWQAKTPYGMIPVGKPGKGGRVQYVDFVGGFAPGVKRGLRSIGASGAYNTLTAGGKGGLAVEKGLTDVINAGMHPVMGPPAQFVMRGLTGSEPYLSGLRDVNTGKPGVQFRTVARPASPGLPQIGENWRSAAVGIAPTVQNLLGEERDTENTGPGAKMMSALKAWSGFKGPLQNPTMGGQRLRMEERKANTGARKYERQHGPAFNPLNPLQRR